MENKENTLSLQEVKRVKKDRYEAEIKEYNAPKEVPKLSLSQKVDRAKQINEPNSW